MGSMRLGSKAIHAFWDEAHAMAMSYKSTIQAEVKDTRSFVSKNKTRAPFLGDSFEDASRQAGRDFKSAIKSDLSTNSIPTLELNPKSGQYMNKGKSSFNHRVEGTTNNYEIGVTNKEPSTAVQEQKKLLTDLNPSSGTYLQNNKGLSTSTEVPGFTGTHKLPSKVKEASVSQEIPEDLLKPVTGSPVGSAAFANAAAPDIIGSLLDNIPRLPRFNTLSLSKIMRGFGTASALVAGLTAATDVGRATFNKEASIKAMINTLSDSSLYQKASPNSGNSLQLLKTILKNDSATLQEQLKAHQNYYLLNQNRQGDKVGARVSLLPTSEQATNMQQREGFNVLDAHGGINERGESFIVLSQETEASAKLGYKVGQRLDAYETSELLLESRGFDKSLPTIITACRVGQQPKIGQNFAASVATMLNGRTIAGDGYIVYQKGFSGDLGSVVNKAVQKGQFASNANVRVYTPGED